MAVIKGNQHKGEACPLEMLLCQQLPDTITAKVGDDLTVTNVTRVKKAIDDKACNALLGLSRSLRGSACPDGLKQGNMHCTQSMASPLDHPA